MEVKERGDQEKEGSRWRRGDFCLHAQRMDVGKGSFKASLDTSTCTFIIENRVSAIRT